MLRNQEESDTKEGCQIRSQGWGTLQAETERKGNSCRSMCSFIFVCLQKIYNLHVAI